MTRRLERGDVLRLRLEGCEDDWTNGWIALASVTNPSSVLVLLHGPVRSNAGIIANVLPLTIDYDAATSISLFGDAYEIEVQA
jgi:hypothetical protein